MGVAFYYRAEMDKNTISVIEKEGLCLRSASKADIANVQTWFSDAQSVLSWGGPSLTYPISTTNFYLQLCRGNYDSFVMYAGAELVAFGQYQLHPPLVHLARLSVHPQHRGKGLASMLLQKLIEQALTRAQLNQASLYVYQSNHIARNLYIKMGFTKTNLPKSKRGLVGCDFMVMPL